MKNKVYIFILLLIAIPVFSFSQSKYLEDGVGGSGFAVNSAITNGSLSSIGFSATYSIGGIMDFGVSFNTEDVLIDSHESTDLNLMLLYNMILLKQTNLVPINIQMEGSYGYTNTHSDYLEENDRQRDAQGFQFGLSIFHEFLSAELIGIIFGGKIEYKNYIEQSWDIETSIPIIASSERNEEILYGGIIGVSFKPSNFPNFGAELTVFYNQNEEKVEYRPSISIINPDF